MEIETKIAIFRGSGIRKIIYLKWSGLSRQKIIKNERENFKKIIIENGLLLV
jgi:hypothetical protein